jgi:hypothetical protein
VLDAATALDEELVEAFAAMCARHPGACFEQHGAYVFVSYPPAPLPALNGVWSGDDDDTAAAALERELERVRATGISPGVCVLGDESRRLLAEARRIGLTETARIPGMIADGHGFRPARVAGVEIEVADTDETLAEANAVLASGFALPPEWFRGMYQRGALGGWTVYLLRHADRAVSTAIGYLGRRGVGIFNVATPEAHRGHGYGAAVTSRAMADGLAAGAEFAYLQSSAIGESVYRRLGFEQVSTYTLAFAPSNEPDEPAERVPGRGW